MMLRSRKWLQQQLPEYDIEDNPYDFGYWMAQIGLPCPTGAANGRDLAAAISGWKDRKSEDDE